MSLILDALRKSEAERRRGQAPSLYAQLPVSAPLRPAWLPWVPVAAGVLLLVGIAVWFAREGDEPVTKEELVEESDGKSLLPPPPGANAAAAPTVAAAPAPPPPVAVTTRPRATPPSVDALVKPPANPAAAKVDAAANAEPAAVAGVTAPTVAAPAPAAPVVEEVPPVAVLDPSTRGSLPPMKLSMHVYNTDSARRFAIIDGQRVTEGAQLGTAIVLEIRRDGVLLDVSGRRVLLPRP